MASFPVLPYAEDSVERVFGDVLNERCPMTMIVIMRTCKAKTVVSDGSPTCSRLSFLSLQVSLRDT